MAAKYSSLTQPWIDGVALRKESVDRNMIDVILWRRSWPSLSARRAWIEIHNHLLRTIPRIVALRKESVDRNYAANAVDQILPGSLSARRAWIEIVMQEIAQQRKQSLSARRAWIEI